MTTSITRLWTVGALARTAGVTVRALHHYDRLGLVPPSSRSHAGHRRYTELDVARLYRVLALRELGRALNEMGAALLKGRRGVLRRAIGWKVAC